MIGSRKLAMIMFGFVLASATAGAGDVESPVYRSWARFKEGTTTVHRSVTTQLGKTIETATRAKLLEKTPELVTIEQTVTTDASGARVENPPQRLEYRRAFPLLPGVKAEDVGRPDGVVAQGKETLTIGKATYQADWFDAKSQTEAGPATTRIWMSDDVPGKLLKSVTRVPKADKVTTLELVEIQRP